MAQHRDFGGGLVHARLGDRREQQRLLDCHLEPSFSTAAAAIAAAATAAAAAGGAHADGREVGRRDGGAAVGVGAPQDVDAGRGERREHRRQLVEVVDAVDGVLGAEVVCL